MIFMQFFDKNFCTCTYLEAYQKGSEACNIDPVFENIHSYLKTIKNLELKLLKVIDTHISSDHITGISALKKKTDYPIIMGELENSSLIANIER